MESWTLSKFSWGEPEKLATCCLWVLNDYKIVDEETGNESFVVGTKLHKQSLGDGQEWEDDVEVGPS